MLLLHAKPLSHITYLGVEDRALPCVGFGVKAHDFIAHAAVEDDFLHE